MYRNLKEAQKAFLESRIKRNLQELEEITKELVELGEQQLMIADEVGMEIALLEDIERQADEIFEKRYGHLNMLNMTEQQYFELYIPILDSLLVPTPDTDDVQ